MRKYNRFFKKLLVLAFTSLLLYQSGFSLLHEHSDNHETSTSLVDENTDCFFCKIAKSQFFPVSPIYILAFFICFTLIRKNNYYFVVNRINFNLYGRPPPTRSCYL